MSRTPKGQLVSSTFGANLFTDVAEDEFPIPTPVQAESPADKTVAGKNTTFSRGMQLSGARIALSDDGSEGLFSVSSSPTKTSRDAPVSVLSVAATLSRDFTSGGSVSGEGYFEEDDEAEERGQGRDEDLESLSSTESLSPTNKRQDRVLVRSKTPLIFDHMAPAYPDDDKGREESDDTASESDHDIVDAMYAAPVPLEELEAQPFEYLKYDTDSQTRPGGNSAPMPPGEEEYSAEPLHAETMKFKKPGRRPPPRMDMAAINALREAQRAERARMEKLEKELGRLRHENSRLRVAVNDARSSAQAAHEEVELQKEENGQATRAVLEGWQTAASDLSRAQEELRTQNLKLEEREKAFQEELARLTAEQIEQQEQLRKSLAEQQAQHQLLEEQKARLEEAQNSQTIVAQLPDAALPYPPALPPVPPTLPPPAPPSMAAPAAPPPTVKDLIGKMTMLNQETALLVVPKLLAEGAFLWKIPYHSASPPQRRFFKLRACASKYRDDALAAARELGNSDLQGLDISHNGGLGDGVGLGRLVRMAAHFPLTLTWLDPTKSKKKFKEMILDEVDLLAVGHKTPAFWAQASHRGLDALPRAELCFSLISEQRTLDLSSETKEEARQWTSCLNLLIRRIRQGESPPSPQLDVQRPATFLPPSTPPPPPPSILFATLSPAEQAAFYMNMVTGLFAAVERQDSDAVREIIASGEVDVDSMDDHTGDTALILACRLGFDDVARVCLRAGARNDPHPSFGQTALQAAVAGGHACCAAEILNEAASAHADVIIVNHIDQNKQAPIHVASLLGHLPVLELLLLHGAELRMLDSSGGTCLHAAVFGDQIDSLAYLLDNGADEVLDVQDIKMNSALHLAALHLRFECARLLLETCANPNLENEDGLTPRSIAMTRGDYSLADLIASFGGNTANEIPNVAPIEDFLPGYGADFRAPPLDSSDLADPNTLYPQSARDMVRESVYSQQSSDISGSRSLESWQRPVQSMNVREDLFVGLELHRADQRVRMSYSSQESYEDPRTGAGMFVPQEAHSSAHGNRRGSWGGRPPRPFPDASDRGEGRRFSDGLPPRHHGRDSFETAATTVSESSLDSSIPPRWRSPSPIGAFGPSRAARRSFEQGHLDSGGLNAELGSVLFDSFNHDTPLDELHHVPTSSVDGDAEIARRISGTIPSVEWAQLSQQEREEYGMSENAFYLVEGNDVWDVLYTEDGYPYFLQVGTGHTQWDDPRGFVETVPGPVGSPSQEGNERLKEAKFGSNCSSSQAYVKRRAQDAPQRDAKSKASDEDESGDESYSESESEGSSGSPSHAVARSTSQRSSNSPAKTKRNRYRRQDTERYDGDSNSDDGSNPSSTQAKPPLRRDITAGPPRHEFSGIPISSLKDSLGSSSSDVHKRGDRSPVRKTKQAHESGSKLQPDQSTIVCGTSAGSSQKHADTEDLLLSLREHKDAEKSIRPEKSVNSSSVSEKIPPDGLSFEDPQFAQYFRMFMVGVPLSSVTHKMRMSEDSFSEVTIEEFAKEAQRRKSEKMNSSTVSHEPSKMEKVASSNSPPCPVHESESGIQKHNPVLEKYVKMASFGVPIESVQHKMRADGVREDVIEQLEKAVTNSSSFHKKAENKEAETVGKSVSKSDLKEDPILGKYVKMASMGVPPESVRHKMQAEGLTEDKIALFESAFGLETMAKPAVETTTPAVTAEELKTDPDLAKFCKMVSLGVPAESVLHKLSIEGVDESKKKAFAAAYGISSGARSPPNRRPPPAGNRPGGRGKDGSNLITVHWDALPQERVENTVWATAQSSCELETEELQQLKSLFTAKPTMNIAKTSEKGTKKKKTAVSLLDGKRSNNIAIALSQFKNFQQKAGDWSALCLAVITQDESELNADKLEALSDVMPNDAEIRKVGGHNGNVEELGRAEQFVFSVAQYPRFSARLNAFAFKLHFSANASTVVQRAATVESAANEIMQSEGLAFMLKQMLVIGNIMNQGTRQGQASGITLESLLKLIHTRGADKKTTVLDYVITLCLDKGQDVFLEFPDDFKSLDTATRIPAREVNRELREIHSKLSTLEREVQTSRDEASQARLQREAEAKGPDEVGTPSSPATPASGGGNAALLAAIRAKKGPGKKPPKQATGKMTSELFDTYSKRIAEFLDGARPKYQDMAAKVEEMESAVIKLIGYFGEDPNRCQAESVFIALQQFIQAFKVSKEKVIRLRKAEEKKKLSTESKPQDKQDVSQLLRSHRSRRRSAIAGGESSSDEDKE